MALILDEDESFSMQANVLTPGYQRVALSGYITKQKGGQTYVAPLLPQLFYGWDGSQLSSWRQYIGGTGAQTILSRSGGLPTIPEEELYWRKVTRVEEPEPEAVARAPVTAVFPVVAGASLLLGLVIAWWASRT